jgi:hypothetical protein
MATALPGVSTLGIKLGWAPATADVNTLPSAVTRLTRINATSEINVEPETIDASALEDYIEQSVAGRASTGGTYTITVNETDATITEWNAVFASSAANGGVWIEEWSPNMTDANWIFVQTPTKYPKSAKEQNALQTVEIACTIVSYYGTGTAIEPA